MVLKGFTWRTERGKGKRNRIRKRIEGTQRKIVIKRGRDEEACRGAEEEDVIRPRRNETDGTRLDGWTKKSRKKGWKARSKERKRGEGGAGEHRHQGPACAAPRVDPPTVESSPASPFAATATAVASPSSRR